MWQQIHTPIRHWLGLVGALWFLLPWIVYAQPGPPKGQTAAPQHCEENAACRKLLLQARKYSAGGRYEQAAAVFQEALKRTEQRDARLHMELGRAYHLWGRISEAVQSYNHYLKSVPPDTPGRDLVLRWLSDALMSEGQPDPAAESALRPGRTRPEASTPAYSVDQDPASQNPESSDIAQASNSAFPLAETLVRSNTDEPLSTDSPKHPPFPCRKPSSPTRRNLLIAGGTFVGVGLFGGIAAAGALLYDGKEAGTTTSYRGITLPAVYDTKNIYIPSFVFAAIGFSAGGAIIAIATVRRMPNKTSQCETNKS